MKAKNTIKTDAAFRRMVDEVAQLMPAIEAKKAELEAKLQAVREEPEAELAELQADYILVLHDKFLEFFVSLGTLLNELLVFPSV